MKPKRRRTMHVYADPTIFLYAKRLRRTPTQAESLLWKFLYNKQLEGIKFRRQHPVSKYVIDFYSHELKLAIEVDGEYHQEKLQKFYDENRDLTIVSYGIKMIRFSNEQVINDTINVINEIRKNILRLKQLKGK